MDNLSVFPPICIHAMHIITPGGRPDIVGAAHPAAIHTHTHTGVGYARTHRLESTQYTGLERLCVVYMGYPFHI